MLQKSKPGPFIWKHISREYLAKTRTWQLVCLLFYSTFLDVTSAHLVATDHSDPIDEFLFFRAVTHVILSQKNVLLLANETNRFHQSESCDVLAIYEETLFRIILYMMMWNRSLNTSFSVIWIIHIIFIVNTIVNAVCNNNKSIWLFLGWGGGGLLNMYIYSLKSLISKDLRQIHLKNNTVRWATTK